MKIENGLDTLRMTLNILATMLNFNGFFFHFFLILNYKIPKVCFVWTVTCNTCKNLDWKRIISVEEAIF